MKKIPYGRQHIDSEDIKQVVKTLKSDWLTQGPAVDQFEKALAEYCGAKYAVAVSNGTAALHLAMLAAGVAAGDEVVTTPLTFLATANSVLYSGARPVFADIEPHTFNADPEEMEKRITGRTKALAPVHFAGLPCDMPAISKIARKNRLKVIEDACHALGSEYRSGGKWIKVGSCRHSDMAVFSFHPVKHITTGEGGAVTTNSRSLCDRLRRLRAHGVEKTPRMSGEKGAWYYEMTELGYNYRLTDIQCSLGISQLKKLGKFVKRRREIAAMYDRMLCGIDGVELPEAGDKRGHAYHLYVLRVDFRRFDTSRKRFFEKMAEKNIFCQVHYMPVPEHPYYRKNVKGCLPKYYPNAMEYYEKAVSIPMFPAMSDADVRRVAGSIRKVLNVR